MAVHPSKRRKRLMMSDEEFFSHCLLALGPPNEMEIKEYRTARGKFTLMGAHPYLREHPWGIGFMTMLATGGEAKCRGAKWLYAYIKWWKEKRKEKGRANSEDRLTRGPGYR